MGFKDLIDLISIIVLGTAVVGAVSFMIWVHIMFRNYVYNRWP